MTIPTAQDVLDLLKQASPRPTAEAPRDARGIYGLYDHTGTFRYIGSTSSKGETFYKRIHQRHRTGSETHSHYFARMYNTGRMWVDRTDPEMEVEMKIARRLRQAFIARYCGCTWVSLPENADIARLEAEVIKLAPPEMIAWNGRSMEAYDEPVALVDALIKDLQISPVERAALGRQRDRHLRGTAIVRTALSQISGTRELSPFPEGPFRFFALDVETANNDRGSICQVGVACVRPDDSIETWMTLVDPETEKWKFSYLHGIDNAMVQGAPRIGAVIDVLDRVLKDHTVYQHSGFDRSAIRAACASLGRPEPSWDWKNSVSVANSAWPELKGNGGHGLASLKAHLGLKFEHHDAGEDARAAAEVVLMAERGTRIAVKPRPASASDDVLDDGDVAHVATNSAEIQNRNSPLAASLTLSKERAKPGSFIRHTSGRDTIRVPVAADGTHFSLDLASRGYYTVGAKGAEEKYDSFDAALDALNRMSTPRWRRPNAAGNWGIVSGYSWMDIKRQ
jgi:DNA polymerase III epsilon subunit-like protein